jgi:2,4-dienoyl-CoA reductase-like NADH-dependent reductase (Old Yellow Enzyme family)
LDVLWDPIKINELAVPNRVFVSAHMMAFFDGPVLGDRLIDYCEERARGGAGLIVTGAEGVDPSGWHPPHFQAWPDEAVPQYEKLADRVGAHGARIFVQLWHCGLQDFGIQVLENQHVVLGPSGIPSPVYGAIAKAMERDDIDRVVAGFGRAALHAREGGIHGVEVAGAHGYLISSFLSSFNNQREDEFGGSVENRCRLAVEVGKEIRRQVGADYPVGLRLNFEEFVGPGGFEPSVCSELLAEIHGHRVFDYFSISGGTYHSQWGFIMPGTADLETPNVPNAALAKAVVKGEVPIMVAQKVTTLERAAEVIAAGEADLVAMTRAHIADPELIRKARDGRRDEIRRCVGFNQGCVHRQAIGGMASCTVNPVAGRESRWGFDRVRPTSSPMRIAIIGGGPAGMKAAEAAATRGHQVRLVEREQELGGLLRYAGDLPGRGRWLDLVEDLVGSMERLGVIVELGVTATAAELADSDGDQPGGRDQRPGRRGRGSRRRRRNRRPRGPRRRRVAGLGRQGRAHRQPEPVGRTASGQHLRGSTGPLPETRGRWG